jgi:CRISPR system Cascade subunit CasD
MTATLLIPLVGPLQAWGVDARFGLRQTGMEPSKSGVIGLCCAALGRDRHDSIEDLSSLLFGVRVDREGHLSRDFHTALDVGMSKGGISKHPDVSNRWYLAHAAFLAGLQGPASVLTSIHQALQQPHWSLALGRKSCPPSVPPGSGALVNLPLLEALINHEPLAEKVDCYRLVLEDPQGSQTRPDQLLGPFSERRFGLRRVTTTTVPRQPSPENQINKSDHHLQAS